MVKFEEILYEKFYMNYINSTNEGHVQFKLYRKQCLKCNSRKFAYAMWYPEQVSKVTFAKQQA